MVNFTEAQLAAIEATGSDILVSAAAGSGKTAVLVERIKRNIISGNYSIDEVFVSTFTNKSAKDMKDKIERALRAIYNETKETRINEEIIKLNDSHISTLHSFCLHLIQTHYNAIGLPPDMRTLGQVEAEIKLDSVISEVLEQFYTNKDQDFLHLDQFVSSLKDNTELHKLIIRLYNTAIATEDPKLFLDSLKDQYINEDRLNEILDAYKAINYRKLKKLDEDLSLLKVEYDHIERPEELKEKAIKDAYDNLDIMQKNVVNALASFHDNGQFSLAEVKLSNGRNAFIKAANAENNDFIEKYNKPVNDAYQELYNQKAYSLSDVREELSPLNGMNNQLLKITESVIDNYKRRKQQASEMDFNDYEHFALDILLANNGEVQQEYRDKFKEVMIDEYQDINRVQEAIIQLLKSGDEANGNLFMVGDVKQSIYRFRQAAPDLFIDKSHRFKKGEAGQLIQLNRNFRSRQEVLDVTNLIFENIMDETIGEIDYTDEEKLIKGTDDAGDESKVEVLPIITPKETTADEADEIEIKELVGLVNRLYNDGVPYGDIVILNRTRFSPDKIRYEFQKAEIPISVDVNKGYFETFEIMTMRSILSLLDNPLQDDHLMGVLRLPMFGFNEEALARIRANSDEKYLYEALLEFNEDEAIVRRIEDFLSTYDELKAHSKFLSVSELIDEIYFELNIVEFFSGLPGGKTRQANLNGLIEKALEFEAMNNSNLYQFISYIDYLIKENKDFGEESLSESVDDSVRVMTVHSSKGLEFKHVIYADLKQQYTMDAVSKILVHAKLGVVFNQFKPDINLTSESIHAFVANEYLKLEQLSEELRLIYVALTRAEEKLYLPLVYKDDINLQYTFDQRKKPSVEVRSTLKSTQDFIAPILLESQHDAIDIKEVSEQSEESKDPRQFADLDDIKALIPDINPEVADRLFYTYPNQQDTEIAAKESVTTIKRRNETIPDMATDVSHTHEPSLKVPNFLASSVEAPIFGTIMHEMMMRIMNQWQSLSVMNEQEKADFIDILIDNYVVNYEQLSDLHISKLKENAVKFFNDDYMVNLLNQQNGIYTELPFIMNQEAILYGEHDDQLVQGIIDCLLVFEDHYIIIDYKTDRVNGTQLSPEDLRDRYKTQMDIYKKSAEVVLNKPVDAVLYFFDYGAISLETYK